MSKVYKIADFYIQIEPQYATTKNLCRPYLCENPPRIDFTVKTSLEDIADEQRRAREADENASFTDTYIETLAVYRKIVAEVLNRESFLIHGALIEYEGKGYLFTALSGTGKTTHIRLWQKAFGEDKVCIVNGDKPILRLIDDVFYGYGTPWCGKENYNFNTRVPLCGIICLRRGETNSISKISPEKALPFVMSQIMVTDSFDLAKQLDLLGALFEKVPVYELFCNISTEAALVARDGLLK